MDTLKFEVSMEEANLLMASLAKQPFEVVVGLIQKLQGQAQSQVTPATSGEIPRAE